MGDEQANAACTPGPFNNGTDIVVCSPGAGESIDTLGGHDDVTVTGGTVNSTDLGTGNDSLNLSGGTVGSSNQGNGRDTTTVTGGTVTGTINQGAGQDTYTQSGGSVSTVDQGTSGDTATIQAGSTLGTINQGSGNDNLDINGGNIGQANQGSFNDTLMIVGGTIGSIDQGTGQDRAEISSGVVSGVFQQGSGRDVFVMSGGTIGSLDQGADFDFATITGGHIIGLFTDGDDVTFSGGRIGSVNLRVADNIFRMFGTANIDTYVNSEQGNDRFELSGGTIGTYINTGSGNDTLILDGTVIGSFVNFENGDDTIILTSGSIGGDVLMGSGSDSATVNSAFATGLPGGVLDGGGDTSIADGNVDTLTFAGWSGSLTGANVLNWENIIIDGGAVSFADNALTTGLDIDPITFMPTSGLTITNGGSLDLGNSFAVTGNVTTQAAGTLVTSTANGMGVFSISGQFVNNGVLDFSGNTSATGDRLTVNGDYFGGGAIMFDVALDASEQTDQLTIAGTVRGASTVVTVHDVGTGLGAPTGSGPGNGIKLIDVSNTLATQSGDFVLNGAVTAGGISGAYVYNLFLETDGNWYLQNVYVPDPTVPPDDSTVPLIPLFAPTVPTYEVYPQVLLGLNGLPTLQQRIGNRGWSSRSAAPQRCGSSDDDRYRNPHSETCNHDTMTVDASRAWARLVATRGHHEASRSTTAASYDVRQLKFEGGVDVINRTAEDGSHLVAGAMVFYGTANADISSPFGRGSIDVSGTGFGLTATHYDPSGLYVDGQARAIWYSSDLAANEVGSLVNGNDAVGYSLGLEIGRRFRISNSLSLTPQSQLIYSEVDSDAFQDPYQGRVTLKTSNSLQLRVGAALNHERTWQTEYGTVSRAHLYGIANVYYEFADQTKVDVSGVGFTFETDRLSGALGVGGTYSWNNGLRSLYGEVSHKTSLSNFHMSHETTGRLGFRLKF